RTTPQTARTPSQHPEPPHGPATPASRIPASTADRPDSTNVAVRMRHTSTPDSIAARGPPPTANTWSPNRVWCNRSVAPVTTTTRTGTAHGSWPTTGTPVIPDRPRTRRLSASAPVGAPPVHRNTAPFNTSIEPSVVMNDGTRSSVVTSPLVRPTSAPKTASTATTHQVRPGSPSPSRAAMTTQADTSAPTDRSNSPPP